MLDMAQEGLNILHELCVILTVLHMVEYARIIVVEVFVAKTIVLEICVVGRWL